MSPPSVDLKIPDPLAAAPQAPRLPIHLPQRRVEDVRIVRIHDEVDGPRALVAEEHLLPRPAPVGGPEDAALGVGPEGMAEGGHVRAVGVRRMDADASDRVCVGEAEVSPALPGIIGAVDAVALEDVGTQLHLAHADVHDIGVGRRHRDRADRGAADLPIGRRRPGGPAVRRLEQPAAGRAEVVLERPLGMARHRDRASPPVRPDRAPLDGAGGARPGPALRAQGTAQTVASRPLPDARASASYLVSLRIAASSSAAPGGGCVNRLTPIVTAKPAAKPGSISYRS